MSEQGASGNEVLLAAARDDNVDLILELFDKPDTFDINFQDGYDMGLMIVGSSALHYACQYGSAEVLEHLLSHENCDVDLQNRLDGDTPLLTAVKSVKIDTEIRNVIVESLLEAGADTKIKDKGGATIKELLSLETSRANQELLATIRKSEAQAVISRADIAEEYDEEDGGEYGEDESEEDD